MIELTDEIRNKLEFVLANVNKIDFGGKKILSLFNDISDDYDWEAGFIGITKDGKICYIFDSGCSCYSPDWDVYEEEEPTEDKLTYNTIKGFELELEDVSNWSEVFDLGKINSKLDEIIKGIKNEK